MCLASLANGLWLSLAVSGAIASEHGHAATDSGGGLPDRQCLAGGNGRECGIRHGRRRAGGGGKLVECARRAGSVLPGSHFKLAPPGSGTSVEPAVPAHTDTASCCPAAARSQVEMVNLAIASARRTRCSGSARRPDTGGVRRCAPPRESTGSARDSGQADFWTCPSSGARDLVSR